MERILIIEDDPVVYEELKKLLRANGYMPTDTLPCDLALLDINLPGKNGFELCRELRRDHATPVIFLTARESVEDELLAFGVGADDFIRKPYHSSVLLARMARLLHRPGQNGLSCGDLVLNLGDMTLELKGKRTGLTKNETRIMACLMEHKMCTRQALVEDLWQNQLYIDENTLYVNINRLREKLKTIGAGDRIQTVRGAGYRLWDEGGPGGQQP